VTPRIFIYRRAYQPWVHEWLDGFGAGLKRHGLTYEDRISDTGGLESCDLAVMWGVRHVPVIQIQDVSDGRYLVLERGYVGNREVWTSAGYDGLNNRADFCNRDVPGSRWARFWSDQLRPWKDMAGPGYVLVLGQKFGDAATEGIVLVDFYLEAAKVLGDRCGRAVVFRPHPAARREAPPGLRMTSGTLEDDLAGAALAVCWNSSSAVAATLAGVPTVCMDKGCMAWDVTAHGLHDDPVTPDRTPWAHRMAWTQWTVREMQRGETWEHLKAGAPWATD